MKGCLILGLLLFTLLGCQSTRQAAGEADWPQYKKDNYRSGTTEVQIELSTLDLDWVYRAPQQPVPAWYGPAYEDAYAQHGPLPSMRDYDLAYYPVVVGESLYYSSTADDAVHCLDTRTGREKWRYMTGGPVHIAPVYHQGSLYFGSDDGFIYCITADRGRLKWKYSPVSEPQRLVMNNGRLISFWPVRTGILIEGDQAYFGASLLPWKKSYFCSVNIHNGKADDADGYVREFENQTFEGSMASSGSFLIQPQGRIAPVFIDRLTGDIKGSLPGSGGCFVLVTKDRHVVHPQTSRYVSIEESDLPDQPDFMTFKDGKEMVVKGDTSYVLTDHSLSAYQRSTKKLLWVSREYQAYRMIMAGDVLFVGGMDTVYGMSKKDGHPLWAARVAGPVYALAVAGKALYVSTGEGRIYCFRSGGSGGARIRIDQKQLILKQPAQNQPIRIDKAGTFRESEDSYRSSFITLGPFMAPVSADTVNLSFQTADPELCRVRWTAPGIKKIFKDQKKSIYHEFRLPVRKSFKYEYDIFTDEIHSCTYQYDNFFNYSIRKISFPDTIFQAPLQERWAMVREALPGVETKRGLCLVLGIRNGALPYELASKSCLDVVVFEPSAKKINKFKTLLQQNECYGRRISVYPSIQRQKLPLASELADLVWVQKGSGFKPDEVIRLIAPRGIAVVKGSTSSVKWLERASLAWQVDLVKDMGSLWILRKHPFEIEGTWTHEYGNADNSAFGGEDFYGSTRSEDFEVQWMGRPGPRYQTDRSGRKPAPLAINGKLFIQGKERVMAIDVYNGRILWTKDFPGLIRMNIHRDCSNWAADEQSLYAVVGTNLLLIDQENGRLTKVIRVTGRGDDPVDWGYLGLTSGRIIGSASPRNSHYTDYHGGLGWYDARVGPATYKVVSTSLFSRLKGAEKNDWIYQSRGFIINSTLTIYHDKICFAESRTPGLQLSDRGRGGNDLFKRIFLVALDTGSGRVVWEHQINNRPGVSAYYMAAGHDKLVIVSSRPSQYNIYAYDYLNGKLSWEQEMPWFHPNHGGHLSRPAIVGNKLMVKPVLFNVTTGERLDYNVPKAGHGCASYALSAQSVFYRGGSVTQFNFDTREFSKWERLRPDCWISTIPAQGMVLSPEAGGGCSCGIWLETSMVMAPVSRAPILIRAVDPDRFPDFKEETYDKYQVEYDPNSFTDSLTVEITVKPGISGKVYYTLDGTRPDEHAEQYKHPIHLDKNTQVSAVLLMQTAGGTRIWYRSQQFTRLERPDK